MTKEELIEFEEKIKQHFLDGKIRFPIHLSSGNEDSLIEIFDKYDISRPENWVFSNHRSHLHALLKGIPKEWLKEQILRGNSMHIMSPEYKFMSSSIVGGCVPQAVGVALGMSMRKEKGMVYCFLGDMSSLSGVFHECMIYAKNFDLPITFIIECNGLSTNTPTFETFNIYHEHDFNIRQIDFWECGGIITYCYERLCPHINIGQFVEFK